MKNEIQFDMRSGDSDAVSRQRPQRQGWRAPPPDQAADRSGNEGGAGRVGCEMGRKYPLVIAS